MRKIHGHLIYQAKNIGSQKHSHIMVKRIALEIFLLNFRKDLIMIKTKKIKFRK
jgi:hypothetical protein